VARRTFDQTVAAGAAGRVGAVLDGAALDGAALDGSRLSMGRPAEGDRPGALTATLPTVPSTALELSALPQKCSAARVLVLAGVVAALGARTVGGLSHVTMSILLGVMICRTAGWFLRAWRSPDFAFGVGQNPGCAEARTLVRAVLYLATTASLLWLFWARPGPWQFGFAVVATAAVTIQAPQWLSDRGRPVRRLSARLPGGINGPWLTIGQLALLNILVALALLNTAKFTVGAWATHTEIAFILVCGADVLLLSTGLSALPASPHAGRGGPRNYVLRADADPGSRAGAVDRVRRGRRAAARRTAYRGKLRRPRPKPGRRRSRGRVRVALAGTGVVVSAGWVAYAHPGPFLVLAAVVIAAAVLATTEVGGQQAITMLLAVALGTATFDYMGWRFAVTNWHGWWIAAPLVFAEALGAVHVLGFQVTIWPWPTPEIEPTEDPSKYEVFMLVATVNEGVGIVRPTLEGCLAAREKYLAYYPDAQVTIVVCNDGLVGKYPDWGEIEAVAAELGVHCVTRSVPGGAKAGNIENARQLFQISGNRLMAMFDADQVPGPDFLLKTILPFADPKVGWVQSGQYYANLQNPVSRWADDQQSMFYNLLCPGKAAMNAAFICGTNVVIRGAALDEIGGLPQDSVTEDFAASILLHPRWRSIYLSDILATGLGPLDIPSYLKQQGRWALGTLAAFRGHWRDILLPKKNGLRCGQRLQYFLAGTHYLCGLRDFIYILSPALFIFTGVPAVQTATLSQYILHFLPYGLLGIAGMWYSARGVTGLRGVIIGFGSTPALLSSLVATVLVRKKPFALTSKARRGRRSYRYLGVYLFPLLLCFAALAWATQARGRQETSMFISLLWVVYSLVLLSSYLWLAYADIRAQRTRDEKIFARQEYPSKLHIRGGALRPVLTLGIAALVASPVLLGSRVADLPIFAGSAPAFMITRQQLDARYVGVSLPIQELGSAPPVLEHALGASFSIVGRTQVIADQFDVRWADKLAAQGTRPWVTLQFGAFGRHHRAPLTANLPAIFNGVNDTAIRRWATEIRDYGKPVFLTVLLQADRNWAVSSGVGNGGIPQDVPKAWLHIQSIFHAVGADNVAWVWAPADPLHDQQFAPPPSSIDVVLQDFINYPGARWGDPGRMLRALAARYPDKAFFVEVAVDGPAVGKAAWLAKFALAVRHSAHVYAVLYHEGGPLLKPTPAQARAWSETSDPASFAVWKRIVLACTADRPGGLVPRTRQ
jgi:cellulose synthase/poly-beta-1,6-N-acetylglucosamine synthase-like glycosyltransferase